MNIIFILVILALIIGLKGDNTKHSQQTRAFKQVVEKELSQPVIQPLNNFVVEFDQPQKQTGEIPGGFTGINSTSSLVASDTSGVVTGVIRPTYLVADFSEHDFALRKNLWGYHIDQENKDSDKA